MPPGEGLALSWAYDSQNWETRGIATRGEFLTVLCYGTVIASLLGFINALRSHPIKQQIEAKMKISISSGPVARYSGKKTPLATRERIRFEERSGNPGAAALGTKKARVDTPINYG